MNKKLLIFFGTVSMLLHSIIYAQQTPDRSEVFDSGAQWTWKSGDNAVQQFGTYGTKGVEASGNKPGTVLSPACWKDKYGKLWMFGGQGYAASPNNGDHNDLWRYNPSNNQWTWMGGTSSINQFGVYGTKRVPSKTNVPGGRRNAMYWTDTAGNFWLFGGNGYASSGGLSKLNDLWVYSPKDTTWTWISGNNTASPVGVFGTKGVPDPANTPGGRGYPNAAVWVDANNNFWIFGGHGQAKTTTAGYLNDLWKFNPKDTVWTWMGGGDVINVAGIYSSTPGSASTSYIPGCRGGIINWMDASGNFWIFGGNGYNSGTAAAERISELWKYNPATGEWTWVGGSNINGSTNLGNYGTRNVASPTNWPGGRSQPGAIWTDAQSNFYFLGGYGWPASGVTGGLNDVWKFNPTTTQWTWIDGSNAITRNGAYGTKGIQGPLNDPGATTQGGQWCDSGNLWYFGGTGLGATGSTLTYLNHLWRYSPSPCNVTIAASRPLILCMGDSVILKANSIATGLTYQWYEGVTPIGTDTAYIAKTAGSYTVKISSSACNNTSQPAVVTVNSLPAVSISLSPATAVICSGKDTALTASGAVSYTWAPPAFTGNGATIRANPLTTTTYTVQGTGANGCIGVASRTVTVNSLPAITITPATATICNGKDTALTAGGGVSYTWLPNTYTGSGASIRATPTTATTYTVTGTDANGCQNTATRAVNVNALPNITITPASAIICAGKDTALTANGGAIYSWLPANGLNTSSGANVRANPLATITYTVTGIDANGCQNTATRMVAVNNNPTVVINPPTAAICNGKDTGFTASGATTYSWTPAPGLNTTNAAAVRANPTITTSYIVTGTDGNSCIGLDTQIVVVKLLPTAIITPSGPVAYCERDSILLTASYTPGANSKYQWKNASTNIGADTNKHMANAAGNYTVTVKDTASCSATSAVVIVSMNTRPKVNLTISGPAEFCEGKSTMLGIPYDTGIAYQWTRSGVNIPYASTAFYQAIESGIYRVTASRINVANCADTSLEVPVIVHPLPNPVLYANGARLHTENIYAAYQWFYMGQALLGQTSWEYTATQEGTYKVLVIDSNNCSNESINRTMVNLGLGKIGSLTDAITLYPNPTQGKINISSLVDVSIQLYNMAGRELQYVEHTKVIDIDALPAGVYMARVLDEDGVLIKVEKIIKQ